MRFLLLILHICRVFLVMSYLPTFLVRPLFKLMGKKIDCVITNVKGSENSYFYLGREVKRLIGFVPPPDPIPVGIAISSLHGIVNITIKVDRSVIDEPSKFIDFVHQEIEYIKTTLIKKDQ